MRAALAVEWLKLRRARTVLVATVLLLVAPPGLALVMVRVSGARTALGAKAGGLAGGGWEAYLSALTQMTGAFTLLGTGIVAAWALGREFVDRTVGSLFATATGRGAVAAAKTLLVVAWGVGVGVLTPVVAGAVGLMMGWPTEGDVYGLVRLGVVAVLTAFLAPAGALAASVGRGYLPAVAVLIGLTLVAQIAATLPAGSWFPWSVPTLWALGPALGAPVPAVRLLVVPVTGAALTAVTYAWWQRLTLA